MEVTARLQLVGKGGGEAGEGEARVAGGGEAHAQDVHRTVALGAQDEVARDGRVGLPLAEVHREVDAHGERVVTELAAGVDAADLELGGARAEERVLAAVAGREGEGGDCEEQRGAAHG